MSEPLTPEEQQAQRLMAMALRGEQQLQDADTLSGAGGAFSVYSAPQINSFAQTQLSRGKDLRASGTDLLEALARRRQLAPEELENLAASAVRKRQLAAEGPKDTSFAEETGLRKELTSLPETKALHEVEANYEQLTGADNTPTGDNARIYALAKIYDPGGRVTADDYDAAKRGQGPMAKFSAYINELEGEGTLSDQTRRNMEREATKSYQRRKKDYDSMASKFTEISAARGLNSGRVVVRPSSKAAPNPPPQGKTGPVDLAAPKSRIEELRAKRAAGTLK
jgi:hypothetical protein